MIDLVEVVQLQPLFRVYGRCTQIPAVAGIALKFWGTGARIGYGNKGEAR